MQAGCALYLSTISKMASLGLTPTSVETALPSLKTTRVGMLITLKLRASSIWSSTLTLPTLISSLSFAISSIIGESILQGPHQSAQKSTSTVLSHFRTSCSKLSFGNGTYALLTLLFNQDLKKAFATAPPNILCLPARFHPRRRELREKDL